jgi:hypothetical protein
MTSEKDITSGSNEKKDRLRRLEIAIFILIVLIFIVSLVIITSR